MELGPTLENHRKEKTSIETILKEFDNETFAKESAVAFFGLCNNKTGEIFDTLLTQEELEKFVIFIKHVGKRVTSAYSQKFDGVTLNKKLINVTELKDVDNGTKSLFFNNLFHDLSHSVGQIARHGASTNITPVQPYLRQKPDQNFNVREHLEDELRGFMFGSLYHPSPYTNRIKIHLEQSRTYEEFKTNFIEKTIRAAIDDNESAFNATYDFGNMERMEFFDKRDAFEEEQKRLQEEIVANPPEDVLRNLEYIWAHRDNPRVLVDLFFKEIDPYIENLKKRKAYLV